MAKIETLQDSVWTLVHDTNGSFCTMDSILQGLNRELSEGTLTNDYLKIRLERMKSRVERLKEIVDNHYKETKNSKLWLEPLQ